MNRIMISAFKSSQGKTTITCGILAGLLKNGLKPTAFKCGPDYIDPLFHRSILEVSGCNLDSFFVEKNILKQLFCEYSKVGDIAVIEGAMGFYDGISGVTTRASAYEISEILDIPVILVVDVRGCGLTLCALLKGVKNYKNNNISAIILNNCSEKMYKMHKKAIESELDIKVIGYVEKNLNYAIENRHLGLVTPDEIENIRNKIDILAENMLKTVDFDEIIKIANSKSELIFDKYEILEITDKKPKLAVANDVAFCFHYRENLDLFNKLGVEIIEFSPLFDEKLPENIAGIYIPGGYPELYLDKLSENYSMINSIKDAFAKKIPTIAECGGFMYLSTKISDKLMVNVIKNDIFNTGKLSRFGYIDLILQKKSFLGEPLDVIKGHEFHYYDSTNNGDLFSACKPSSKINWTACIQDGNLIAGFPHFYFYSNITMAQNFVLKMINERDK